MTWYAIRLSIVFALVTTILVLVMAGLGQMNLRRDWIFYRTHELARPAAHLHDLERHISTLLPHVGFATTWAFNSQHVLASVMMVAIDREGIVIHDVFTSGHESKSIFSASVIAHIPQLKWSPDGQYLAFLESEPDIARLYVWNGEIVIPVNLPEAHAQVESMVWSYDNRLAFTLRPLGEYMGRPHTSEAYLWDGQRIQNISRRLDRNETLGSWSRNGHLVYFSQGLDDREVMIWDGSNTIRVFGDLTVTSWLKWNSANELTVSGSETNIAPLQIYRWDGQHAVRMSQNTYTGYTYQTWNTDGRWAFSVIDPAVNNKPVLIEVRDSNNQILASFKGNSHPIWSTFGTLIFCQQQHLEWRLMSWDGQRTTQVTEYGIVSAMLLNGETLICESSG